ncbi:hypothetical protein [Streptomyces sp. NPDC047097]|uniref:hypothetical protein n=1 Tax=Streptomyces sp. NPDC047097 TaxID=3155260 RepID=UPI0034020497
MAAAVAAVGALPVPVAGSSLERDARLEQIDAREKAAAEGPWCTDGWEIWQGAAYEPGLSARWIGETCTGVGDLAQDEANAAFTAHARTDVPWLVAQVRELAAEKVGLRARVAELEAERGELNAMVRSSNAAAVKARARVAELEAAVAAVPGCDACGRPYVAGCPDCGACEAGCYGGHDEPCIHPNALWGTS